MFENILRPFSTTSLTKVRIEVQAMEKIYILKH